MATVANLGINFQSNLAHIEKDFKRTSSSVRKMSGDVSRSMRSMRSAIDIAKGAFAGWVGVHTIRSIGRLSDEITDITNKLRVVSDTAEEAEAAFKGIERVSIVTHSAMSATAGLYSRMAVATEHLGYSQEELLKMTQAVNQTFRISGATAQETAAASLQLAQGLASGRFQGDELRSVLENNTRFGKLLAEAMGVTRGALRDLGAEGAITAEIVGGALLKSFDQLNKEASKIAPTFSRTFTVMNDQFKLGFVSKTSEQFADMSANMMESAKAAREFGEVAGSVVNGLSEFGAEVVKVTDYTLEMIGGWDTVKFAVESTIRSIKAVLLTVQVTILEVTRAVVHLAESIDKVARKAADLLPGVEVSQKSWFTGAHDVLAAGSMQVKSEILALARQHGQDQAEFFSPSSKKALEAMRGVREEAERNRAALREAGKTGKKTFKSVADGADDAKEKIKKAKEETEKLFEQMKSGSENLISDLLGRNKYLSPIAGDVAGLFSPILGKLGQNLWTSISAGLPSFDVGTPYVQRDMVAKIHEGERVMTRAENRAYSQGMTGGGTQVNINVVNNAGAQVSARQTQGSNGQVNIELMVDQIGGRLLSDPRSRMSTALRKQTILAAR